MGGHMIIFCTVVCVAVVIWVALEIAVNSTHDNWFR